MKSLSPLLLVVLLGILLSFPFSALAQNPIDANKLIPDSTSKLTPPKAMLNAPEKPKRFGRAAWQLGLGEAIPFTFNTINGSDFAKVTFKSIGHNLNPGNWRFDKDIFQTNQFGHPYHGSLYYSAFRNNGYNFWQSSLGAAAGSYLWETFGENEPPSPNDFVNTTFGGIVLGEMTHRIANRMVSNKSRGFKRQLTEVAAFVINPMNGLNRIIDGKWGKRSTKPEDRDSSKITAEFDLGVRSFNANNKNFVKYGEFGWFARAKLFYGNRYEDYSTPFSNIYVAIEVGRDDSSAVNNISAYGSLAGWEIRSSRKLQHLLILSANYDYIKNEAIFYGGQSVKLNLFSQFAAGENYKFTTTLGFGPVLLGAVPDRHFTGGRSYSYGSGASFSGGGGVSIHDKFFISADYRGAILYTINGSKGHNFLHTITGELRYQPIKNFSFAAEPGYYVQQSNYKEFPDSKQMYPYTRLSARYSLN